MPTATQSRLGIMIREIRERAGLTQEAFAKLLSLREASVRRLEMGSSKLLSKPSFYQRLRDVPGFTESDVTSLLLSNEYASDWLAPINQREYTTYTRLRSEAIDAIDEYLFNYHPADLNPHGPVQLAFSDDFSIICGILPDRRKRYLIISVVDYDRIRLQTVSAWMESGKQLPGLEPEQQDDPSAAQGRNAPELVLEQLSQGAEARKPASPERPGRRRRGVVYERTRTHYDREYLRENAGNFAGLLVDAVENNHPVLGPKAEQALQSIHVFAETLAKTEGSSLSKVARDHDIPLNTLSRWVIDGLVQPLYRDKKTIYIANKTADELARIKQEAIEMGVKPGSLLKERRNK